ncbi:hypothetical protein EIP86_006474 [Pleurotus ostreatoroseus]|nr:hypothetical protein EIP86_006474 [Pleurotus ostreatoroseus]
MMTSIVNTFVLFFLAIAAVVSALPVAVRDVYAPPITYPHAGTVWTVGQRHNVTWDTTNPPKQITNSIGQIILAKNGIEDWSAPLAANFSILLGRIEVTVPDVESGTDYSLVLFGDSGNYSPEFTITN